VIPINNFSPNRKAPEIRILHPQRLSSNPRSFAPCSLPNHAVAKGRSQLEVRQGWSATMEGNPRSPDADSLFGLRGRDGPGHPAVAWCEQVCV
jgi:hypothetical protein